MGAEYLSVTLPGDVKELMNGLTAEQVVGAIRKTTFSLGEVIDSWELDLDDAEDVQQLMGILKDSVDDLSYWGKSSLRGTEFYRMGGDSWGDSPYEGFTEHVIASEILTVLGKM